MKLGALAAAMVLGSVAAWPPVAAAENESGDEIYLEEGKLFVVREADRAHPGGRRLQITTKDMEIGLLHGECLVSSDEHSTTLRVFGDTVQAGTADKKWTVHEGFQLAAKGDEPGVLSRMEYKDYDPWQAWIRRRYAQKDKLAAQKLKKELTDLG